MSRMSEELYELAVVGSGPGGLSAAAHAAEQGLAHVLLESAEKHANTVQRYQHHKHVMAEPSVLPLCSDVAFSAGRREEILEAWQRAIETRGINIRYRSEVTVIEGAQGGFSLRLKSGGAIRARNVILALGVQGNPRQLNVPGGDLPCVQYTLESAEAHRGEQFVIIGAGDAAIENAISLARNNRVTLLNRGNGFPRAKEGNAARILRAVAAGQVHCISDARPKSVERSSGARRTGGRHTGGRHTGSGAPAPYVIAVDTPNGELTVPCHWIVARLGAIPTRQLIEGAGARFLSDAPDAAPELSARYESTVPGLYVIGALAGFPLIKQAMNQGYEVVEHLLGRVVQPADHDILAATFKRLRNGHDVDTTLRKIHGTVRVFRDVKELALRELMLASKILTPAKGTQLFTRGVYSSSVFNILRGEVHLSAGAGTPMTLRAGQLFGEMALISGRPHETTAVAGADCIVLETPHSAMRKLVRSEQSVRAYVDKVYALRALRVFLMPHATPQTVAALSEGVRLHRIKADEALFRQGDPADRFYMVRSGSVSLSRETDHAEAVIAYGAAGAYLDAAGCLAGESVRSMNARATVVTEALSIDQQQFRRLLAADPLVKAKLQAESAQQLAKHAHMQAQPQAGKVFSYLMSHGLGEATSVLVIDEDLCVGCDQCEKACAATHDGVSRLDRSAGPSLFSLHLPTSCRHCEHPHCMQDCPPNAIHRLPDGEVSIADTCIGCGNCVENCPYGVIQLAQVAPKASLLSRISGRPPKDVAKTAVKCDVCASLKGGPACVRACPTGAAIRIHAEDVLKLAKRRAAAAQQ
jgi:Fe-S-cluster-containing dehydrogenase component/CRP-like cAMP-binding protein/thioredoxin reductase